MKTVDLFWYLIVGWLCGGSIAVALEGGLFIYLMLPVAFGLGMLWLSMTIWMMIHKRRY